MLFSLSQEVAQGLGAEQAPPTVTTIFAKFNMKGGLVREIRVLQKTLFSKLKRAVCECEALRADEVCVFFEGKELLPGQRPRDVDMRSGAVVSVIERELVYATREAAGSGTSRMLQGCELMMTVGRVVEITGAASPQALVEAIEGPGWITATPKFRQLARDFYGHGDAAAAEDDDLPLSKRKELHQAKRRRTNAQN